MAFSLDPAVTALTALAVVLACVHLGTKSLDADETVSAHYAQLGFGQLWQVITGSDPNMGLYYVLLHFWVQVFGSSEVALRAMGVLLSSFAIVLIVAVGTRLFNRRAGLVAGFLLAINAAFLASEQDTRSYGPLVTVTLLATYLFLRALDDPSPRRLAAYFAASVAGVYTHYFAALVLLVQLLALLCRQDQREHVRAWALTGAAVAVCALPEVLFARHDRANVAWIQRPSVHDLLGFPGYLTGGDVHGGSAAACLLMVVILYWLVREFRGHRSWETGFVLTWLILPVLLDFLESRVGQSFWVNQYLIVVLPAFLLLAGAGMTAIPRVQVAAGVLVVAVVLLVAGALRWYRAAPDDNYRAASSYVLAHEQAGDVALYNALTTTGIGSRRGYMDFGVEYYALRQGKAAPPAVELNALDDGGAVRYRRVWFVMRGDAAATAAALARVSRALAPVYVVSGRARDFTSGPTVALFVRRKAIR